MLWRIGQNIVLNQGTEAGGFVDDGVELGTSENDTSVGNIHVGDQVLKKGRS